MRVPTRVSIDTKLMVNMRLLKVEVSKSRQKREFEVGRYSFKDDYTGGLTRCTWNLSCVDFVNKKMGMFEGREEYK